jgi:betaine-aldehyde dehydrogenase
MTLEIETDTQRVLDELAERRFGMLIDGDLVQSRNEETMPSYSPSLERQVATVPAAGTDDVDAAVGAARRAFPQWRELDRRTRARHVRRVMQAIVEHEHELGALDAIDGGNPVTAMRADVALAESLLR